jgi:hypothetical protein
MLLTTIPPGDLSIINNLPSQDAHFVPLLPSEETTDDPLQISDVSSTKTYNISLPFADSVEQSADAGQNTPTLISKVKLSADESTLAPPLLAEEPANITTWPANQTQPESSLTKLLVQEAIKQNCSTSFKLFYF